VELLSLALGASLGIGAATLVGRNREHRTEPAGLADLLGWAFLVDDGVVLCKDGALLAGFRYQGPDLGSATGPELDALATQLNDTLLPLGEGWMVHVDAIRAPAPPPIATAFPDPVSAWIDAERRAAFASAAAARPQFVSTYTLTVTYLPPREMYARAGGAFLQRGDDARNVGSTEHWSTELDGFRAALGTFEHRLAGHLHVQRLGSDALLTHLHRCLTGLNHPVSAPPHGAYLNGVLASQELIGGHAPRIGELHLRLVAIAGYPATSAPGRLDFLNALPFAYRWSSRFIPVGAQTGAAIVRRHQQRWFMGRKGVGAFLRDVTGGSDPVTADRRERQGEALFYDHDATAMARDAAAALAENNAGTVRFGLATQVIVIADPEARRADEQARAVLVALQDHGLTARIETVNALDAFFGTLPAHGAPNLRRPLLSTANVVDCWPVTSVWPGLERNPSPFFPAESPPLMTVATDGSTPFRLNLHVSDTSHTLVVGSPGSGKSSFVGLVTAQWRRYGPSAGARTFVFDVGYSHWLLCRAIGGRHYDVAAGRVDTLAFQPLADVDQATERAWAASWLETLLELQGVAVGPRERARLDRALALLAEQPRAFRTLTELTVQLQDPALVEALRPYTVAGSYGALLDAGDDALDDDTCGDAAHQVFELRALLDLDDKILVPTLLYLFRRVERSLDGRPTLIVIEELWAPLMRTAFASRIRQWLLTLRKQNATVMLVAHTLAQLDAVPAKQVLVESCPTRVLLPNPEAGNSANARLYRDLGLNDREIGIIAGATPRRDYYVSSPLGRRLVRLELGPVALAFLGTPEGLTLDAMRPQVERLIVEAREDWPAWWLAEQGLSIPADVRFAPAPHATARNVSCARADEYNEFPNLNIPTWEVPDDAIPDEVVA
jgi:type IV secretion system protein VirB4